MLFLIHVIKTYREIHYSANTCVYSRIAAHVIKRTQPTFNFTT